MTVYVTEQNFQHHLFIKPVITAQSQMTSCREKERGFVHLTNQ